SLAELQMSAAARKQAKKTSSKTAPMLTAATVDLDEVLQNVMLNLPTTQTSYNVYVRKFLEYLGQTALTPLQKSWLADKLMGGFIYALGVKEDHAPHFLKGASASLGTELLRFELPGIYTSPHLYPICKKVIKDWHNANKLTPWVKEKAQGFSNLAIAEILSLLHKTPQELRDLALICVSLFTGLRMQDLHRLFERNVEHLQMEGKTPRRFKLTMEVTKTNRGGVDLTLQESTVIVPCICMEGQDMTTAEGKAARKAFIARIKRQFDCP
ncbi:hypothetical protein B484DRAFT_440659, partial [Ochromonadaceae sp. CCMP2298]